MTTWRGAAFLGALVAALMAPAPVRAQAATGTHEPEAAEASADENPWAIGLGAGIVQPDGGSEAYWSANLRRRVSARSTEGSQEGVHPPEGLKAYLEGEVGYWKQSTATTEDKDLLLGANLIGAVPTRNADIFIGVGFGAHFTDTALLRGATRTSTSKTRLGGNLQFGVEARVSERFGVFGVGRIDFISGDRNRQQFKVWGGVRYRF
jgi:hypothetical protein